MRLLPLLLAMSACTLSEGQSVPYAPPADQMEVGFARLASAENPGYGVVPDVIDLGDEVLPIGWASMGDRLCEIIGSSGTIDEDVYVEGTAPLGVEPVALLDAAEDTFVILQDEVVSVLDGDGRALVRHPAEGFVEDAALAADGTLAVLTSGEACTLSVHGAEGTTTRSLPSCEGGRVEIEQGATWVRLHDRVLRLTDTIEERPFDVVSVDPHSGDRVEGTRGAAHLTIAHDGVASTLTLPGGLVDAAVRGQHIVALTDSAELVLASALDGQILAQQPYYGSLDVERLHLSADGRGLVAEGAGLQFYEVRNRL